MRLSYDPRHNIAYIRLRERQGGIETVRVSDELSIDLVPDGTVYGIELLNTNEQLKAADGSWWWTKPAARNASWRSPELDGGQGRGA